MSKFQIGDRVKVYWGERVSIGVVSKINESGSLDINCGSLPKRTCVRMHPKQCRKLVKAKPLKFTHEWIEKMLAEITQPLVKVKAYDKPKLRYFISDIEGYGRPIIATDGTFYREEDAAFHADAPEIVRQLLDEVKKE